MGIKLLDTFTIKYQQKADCHYLTISPAVSGSEYKPVEIQIQPELWDQLKFNFMTAIGTESQPDKLMYCK